MNYDKKAGIRVTTAVAAASVMAVSSVCALASDNAEKLDADYKTEEMAASDVLKDELEELLENAEKEMQGAPAVSEYLGLEELADAIEDHGFEVKLLAGLSDETAEDIGLSEEMAEGSCLELQVQADPQKRQWQFGAGLSVVGMDLFRLGIYGEHDLLAVSLPQLYEKTIGIGSGNLYEMLDNSWVKEAAGEIPESLKKIELNFYPDGEDCEEWQDLIAGSFSVEDLDGRYDELLEAFADSLEITKEEDGDSGYDTVYHAEAPWESLKEFYLSGAMLYMEPFASAGMISQSEMNTYESAMSEAVEEMFAQAQAISPENPSAEFYVMDGRLEKILCEMEIDTTAVQKTEMMSEAVDEETELLPETNDFSGDEPETADTEGLFSVSVSTEDGNLTDFIEKGSLEFEAIFWGETDGYTNADYNAYVKDEEGNVVNSMNLTRTHSEEGTVSGSRIGLLMMEGDECTYYCDLFESSFDSATGEYSVKFSMADTNSSDEVSDTVYLEIAGSFSDVAPGQSFTCNYEKCTVGQNYEDMGALSGSIRVQAKPGEISKPQEVEMLFEMTEDQAKELVNTVESNLNAFFGIGEEPETEETDLADMGV